MLICNGFKLPGSLYSKLLCEIITYHPNTIPIIDDAAEIKAYAAVESTGHKIQVGIRLKCWGRFEDFSEMNKCDCRFGFTTEQGMEIAEEIMKHPSLELKVFHAVYFFHETYHFASFYFLAILIHNDII